jgi:hypothetical protein
LQSLVAKLFQAYLPWRAKKHIFCVDKVAFMYDSSTVKLLFKKLDEYLAHWDAATASGIP